MSDRELLAELHLAALRACHAGRAVERTLGDLDLGDSPIVLLACGKAASAMAAGASKTLGDRIVFGEVTTKDAHGRQVAALLLREAAHPIPDARSVAAAQSALSQATLLAAGHRLLVLISGGASALWCAPVEGVSLAAKQQVTELLLRCGAEIAQVNTVRKHLSRIKGGRLARAAAGHRVVTLAVSDVAGDDPGSIGSGPTSVDPSCFADAVRVLERHQLIEAVPPSVRSHLERGRRGQLPENLKAGELPEEPVLHVVASLGTAIEAAAARAEGRGLRTRRLGRVLYGEARELATPLLHEVARARRDGIELLVAGGEPTVQVRGDGLGGRCQELALAFALASEGQAGISALFAGTDGTDGPTDAAGAFSDAAVLPAARAAGLDPGAALARNDSHALLDAAAALYRTGPTNTNVNDLALLRLRPVS